MSGRDEQAGISCEPDGRNDRGQEKPHPRLKLLYFSLLSLFRLCFTLYLPARSAMAARVPSELHLAECQLSVRRDR